MKLFSKYFFRARDKGALVFRIDSENRQQRIAFRQIATVNNRNGEVRVHGDYQLTDEDLAAIEEWVIERNQMLDEREIEDVYRLIDSLNHTTDWISARANDEQISTMSGLLLLAMHDLRSVLVRKMAEQVSKGQKTDG